MAVFCSKRPRRGGSMKCHGADLGRDKLRHHSERGNCAMVWKVHHWWKEWWNHWLSHWWIIDGDIIWINGTWYLYNNIYTYTYIHTYIHPCIALHCIALHYITLHYIYIYIYVYIHTYIHTCLLHNGIISTQIMLVWWIGIRNSPIKFGDFLSRRGPPTVHPGCSFLGNHRWKGVPLRPGDLVCHGWFRCQDGKDTKYVPREDETGPEKSVISIGFLVGSGDIRWVFRKSVRILGIWIAFGFYMPFPVDFNLPKVKGWWMSSIHSDS